MEVKEKDGKIRPRTLYSLKKVVVLKRTLFLCLLLLVGGMAVSQDIRSQVVTGSSDSSISNVLDTKQGIFGVPFGRTEDQFIEAFGQPSGYISLLNEVSLMIYGYRTTFVFRAKQLVGITMIDHLIPYEIRGIVRPSQFDRVNWVLSNGITTETGLVQVKKILGLPELQVDPNQRVVYDRDGVTVVLLLARKVRQDANGKELTDYVDSDYSVYNFYFVRTEALPYLGIK